MVGQKHNELTVLRELGARRGRVECRCDCGRIVVLPKHRVLSGNTKSCGCRISRVAREKFTKHGAKAYGKVSAAYHTWQMMKNRCLNVKAPDYRHYGGRGITIDPRWLDFSAFLADMGEPEIGMTLDRIDGTKGYSKDNCCWASKTTQSRNRKYRRPYTYQGETLQTWEWAERLGIKLMTFHHRLWKHTTNSNFTWADVFAMRGGK